MPKSSSFSTKDLGILQELMTNEMLMHKKCSAYAQQTSDTNLRNVLLGHANHHKKRFDTLFSFLGQQ